MLDDYQDNDFYKYAQNLKNYYHAYIFEVDNIKESFPLILAFVKMLICKNHYTNNKSCLDCNICHLIDNNTYSDLKIIEPDGMSIKKEQIQDIQKSLSLKSSSNMNQVYIIKEAEKMNPSASNSLLKFIEEPEDGIYAILITENRTQILPTIMSRCNLISLSIKDKENYDIEEIKNLTEFITRLIKEKENFFPYIKSLFLDKYMDRDSIVKAFNIMEVILFSKINDYYGIKNMQNTEFYDIIKENLNEIALNDLIFYLEKVVKFKNMLVTTLNLNLNLFMDRFVIEISKIEVV